MPIPDEEMARLCRSVLGEPLDPQRRASIAAQLEAMAVANLAILRWLPPQAEPEGFFPLLRRARRDG
ncbi:MAG: hypothetical protein AABZ64_10715 [Nitrospinota bacterium]